MMHNYMLVKSKINVITIILSRAISAATLEARLNTDPAVTGLQDSNIRCQLLLECMLTGERKGLAVQ